MKRILPLIVSSLTILLCATTARAQQKISYRATTYIKIAPGKEAAALDFAKTTGMKLILEEIKSGVIASWVLARITYSGIPAADYNYIQAIGYDGAPQEPNPEARDQMFRKTTGMSFVEYQQKLASFGSPVGSVLSRVEAALPGPQTAEGNYIQTVQLKITPQRRADYENYIRKTVLPLNVQLMKDGRIVGWSSARTVYPGGDDALYDATASFIYKDRASALPTTAVRPDQAQIDFAKVFPGQNYTALVEESRALRRVVRTDLWRVMLAASR